MFLRMWGNSKVLHAALLLLSTARHVQCQTDSTFKCIGQEADGLAIPNAPWSCKQHINHILSFALQVTALNEDTSDGALGGGLKNLWSLSLFDNGLTTDSVSGKQGTFFVATDYSLNVSYSENVFEEPYYLCEWVFAVCPNSTLVAGSASEFWFCEDLDKNSYNYYRLYVTGDNGRDQNCKRTFLQVVDDSGAVERFSKGLPSKLSQSSARNGKAPGIATDSSPSASQSSHAGSGTTSAGSPSSGPSAGTIAGAVVGGVAGLAIIILLIYFGLRRARRRKATAEKPTPAAKSQPEKTDYNGTTPTSAASYPQGFVAYEASPQDPRYDMAEAPTYSTQFPGEMPAAHGASELLANDPRYRITEAPNARMQ